MSVIRVRVRLLLYVISYIHIIYIYILYIHTHYNNGIDISYNLCNLEFYYLVRCIYNVFGLIDKSTERQICI